MTIELYATPSTDASLSTESPISSTTGELPDQEPTIDFGDLLGSFDSHEELIDFVREQYAQQNQQLLDSQVSSFDAYTHVELLTITVQTPEQTTFQKRYYLVLDEGY